MFAGFQLDRICVGEAELRVRHGRLGAARRAPPRTPAEAPEALAGEVLAFLRTARA